MVFLLVAASFCEEDAGKQKELLKIQAELAQQKQKLKETKVQEQRALSSLYTIKRDLEKAQQSLKNAKTKVGNNEKKIVELKVQHADAEENIKKQSKQLKNRIIEVYKSGSGGLIDIVFASKSMSDFINRTYYFGRLLAYDAALISNIRQQVETIKRTESELKGANREIREMVGVISAEKQRITQSSKAKERVYQLLKARSKEFEQNIRQLEASSREIEKFIQTRGRTTAVSSGTFGWPVSGRLASRFGYRRHPIWGGFHLHTGLDVAAPFGRPIASSDSGEVIFSGWWDGYGKAVVVDHGRGLSTVYGHMSRIYMQAGQRVEKGQIIGLVGSTGFSTGPHLHFEIRYNGRPVDPLAYLH